MKTHHDLALRNYDGEFCMEANASTYLLPMLSPYIRLRVRTENYMFHKHIPPSTNKRPPGKVSFRALPVKLDIGLLCVPLPVTEPKLNLKKSDFWNISLF